MEKRTEKIEEKQRSMPDSELIKKAYKVVYDQCEKGKWTMCVPPHVDDSDMILCELIRRYEEKDKLQIQDVVSILHKIAYCIDNAVENTNRDDDDGWDRIYTAVELLCDIADDNECLVRSHDINNIK